MVSARDYSYDVDWSEQDQEYVGTSPQFPLLSWLAKGQLEALVGIATLVSEILADMRTTGETPPPPPAIRHRRV